MTSEISWPPSAARRASEQQRAAVSDKAGKDEHEKALDCYVSGDSSGGAVDR